MAIIIDPPVTPYSSLAEIQDWIKELEEMLRDASADNVPAIERELERAREWAEIRGQRET